MKRRRPGRPSLREGSAKVGMFAMRLSEEDRAAIDAAAEKAGKPVTQWARDVLMGATTEESGDGESTKDMPRRADGKAAIATQKEIVH